MKKYLFLLLFLFCAKLVIAQKQITAKRIDSEIKIDAKLDEDAWQQAVEVTDFIQREPGPGVLSKQQASVRLVYTDKAIYIGAHLYDTHPDSIMNEMTERDRVGITDWFAVVIDAYQDGQNGVGFVVTPSGIQSDIKYSSSEGGGGGVVFGGDQNWDAVWKSEAKIVADGWIVEMSIPYSAIRFPNKDIQLWNINFGRMIRRYRETSFWNEVKPDVDGFLNQSGTVSGIQNVKSPLRLSATPFLVAYAELYHDQSTSPANTWGSSISGGMDVKYGINDAFTLDMTLIPDFGQTRSDNQVLNLSPFEVRFDENRPFFTEGTELFNKGDLFYSRRVGGLPIKYGDVEDQLLEDEEVISNPLEAQLYNATKVSGRTNDGLGIGFFNATSQKTDATIENIETEATRSIETNPLTNYNVLIFDQNLKNNSSVTLVNTNVMREGAAYDANTTGGLFNLRNKSNNYGLQGGAVLSQQYFSAKELDGGNDSTGLGYSYNIELGKISGQFQYGLEYKLNSRHYNTNDLGFLFRPNEQNAEVFAGYNIFKPFGIFNRMRLNGAISYSRLHQPNKFTNTGLSLNYFAVTRSFFAFGLSTFIEPFNTYDYYEPRTENFERYYKQPGSVNVGSFVSSDYRKRVAYDINANYRRFGSGNRARYNLSISPRLRINDRLSFIINNFNTILKNDIGYVNTLDDETIVFGRRDLTTIENVVNAKYIFSNKIALTFRLRHYWSVAKYKEFSNLGDSGELLPSDYIDFSDNSFNAFNIDMVFRWRFAPGSDVFVVWKNAIAEWTDDVAYLQYGYGSSLERLSDIPQSNSFSVKIIYFLDYLNFKKEG